MVKEPVPGHRQMYLVPRLGHAAFGQGAYPLLGRDLSPCRAERRKIVGAQQHSRRLVHRGGIHRTGQLQRQSLPERVAHRALVHSVAVPLGRGVVPGVKFLRGLLAAYHGNIPRQVGVQRPLQGRGFHTAAAAQRRHKAQRVHSAVGTGTAGQRPPLPQNRLHGVLHGAADGGDARLYLPAAVGSSLPA